MTRGRKKDMTIPPSRSLAQQRAYRDRRAKYVADLEERCRVAEAENTRLRRELAIAKAGSSGGFDEDMINACSELMEHLGRTQTTLARFHQMASSIAKISRVSNRDNNVAETLATFFSQTIPQGTASNSPGKSLERVQGTAEVLTLNENSALFSVAALTPAGSYHESESECCGGYIDCEGLVEEEEAAQPMQQEDDLHMIILQRLSDRRSTLQM
ncbi:hypothetical protein HETIRDRAFT_434636 [Heterobasidion irregulare TC 32-1]|uniref:BZIP domain-containing protein n=1 Tax=Heterobasidion irregulare (strain TC 32-1) TaxID=747525 RepID=W4K5D9_HETIT|nr:uncharacterized protein HETIRDRAFT_434636 [Heterobasidion irregulare TC 32-1]ETW80580.1 hypothetical protein HETIRDRAFT_434636 [Heterobasidion irregulare TC 32-1]